MPPTTATARPGPPVRWWPWGVGLLLGLAQFATTFGVTSAYVRYADRTLDPRSAKIREEMEAEGLL